MKKIIETIIIFSFIAIFAFSCSYQDKVEPKKTVIEKTKEIGCKINPWCKTKS